MHKVINVMKSNFKINNPFGLAFGGLWGTVGGMFTGIIIGAITGWASGGIVGVYIDHTIRVGAWFGSFLGIIGGLIIGALAGNVSSSKENRFYGQQLSKFLMIGLPISILLLSAVILVTTPIHPFLLDNFINPIISHPPNVPEKQVKLPDGYVNVFHFTDRKDAASQFDQTYQQYQAVFDKREYQVVEGLVKVLHIFPPQGHDKGDIIVIDGAEFEITPHHKYHYNKPIVDGGILTEGRYARVYYYDGKILAIDLKLEAN
jgi:hypothetical protein